MSHGWKIHHILSSWKEDQGMCVSSPKQQQNRKNRQNATHVVFPSGIDVLTAWKRGKETRRTQELILFMHMKDMIDLSWFCFVCGQNATQQKCELDISACQDDFFVKFSSLSFCRRFSAFHTNRQKKSKQNTKNLLPPPPSTHKQSSPNLSTPTTTIILITNR